jgi:predicted Ser/Thr protein kinase
MKPAEWRRVNELFHQALAQPADARPRFVAEACGADEPLAAEVNSLLAAHDRAAEFIEQPALELEPLAPAPLATEYVEGRVVGQYQIERVLGRGGMGVVYLALDQRLGRRVALKAVAPTFIGDEASRDRLRREARAAAALSDPGIATVYALEELDGQLFIAGEYVPGETLRDEIARGPLAPEIVLRTAILIARALGTAHDHGIIHRDLKPENLMRTPSGGVKILDFGLARMRNVAPEVARLTGGRFIGTPAYMSPEQIRGDAIDARSDLFSIGTVLHELLTGRNPFGAADTVSTIAMILEANPDPPRLSPGENTALFATLTAVIRTCLQKSPAARFDSARDLLRALEGSPDLARPAPGAPPSPAASVSAPRLAARKWWEFHQAATCLAYGVLLGVLWWSRGGIGGPAAFPIFLGGLVAGLGAMILRLHRWFTVREIPGEWRTQRRRTAIWLRSADAAFALALVAAGMMLTGTDHAETAAFLVGSAVAVVLSFAVIEPATTRASFGD